MWVVMHRRNNALYSFCNGLSMLGLSMYHKIYCSGEENVPETGPALLVPKHQSLKDILLEGYFLATRCNQRANWIMKSSLTGFLEYLGGIKVTRPRDLRKIKDKKKRRKTFDMAKKQNAESMDYTKEVLLNGEIVVAHLEGTRHIGEVGPIQPELLKFASDVQKNHNLQIPVIPIGIQYKGMWRPRSPVYIRAGQPLDVSNPDIADVVKKEITRLSGLG